MTLNLKLKDIDAATEAKHRLEEKQRAEARERKENEQQWETRVRLSVFISPSETKQKQHTASTSAIHCTCVFDKCELVKSEYS